MIRYLIKNNIKIMSRSMVNVLCFILCPMIVSAVLISAFSSLLNKYEGSTESFIVGYSIKSKDGSESIRQLLNGLGSNGDITFAEYQNEDPETILSNSEVASFVEFGEKDYKIYVKDDFEIQGKIIEGMLSVSFNSMMVNGTDPQTAAVTVNKADFIPPVDSTDYYGIIYIVYFAWCAIVCASGLLSNEKKYGIDNRFRISGISEFKLYLAKFLSVGIVVLAGITLSSICSALLLGVHWGNILLSALIVLILVMASTAFGLMFYSITNSLVLTVIIVFAIVWILGFIGGSFEVYMFSSTPESVRVISPIYHENRALIELLVQGKSEYLLSAILYPLALVIGCSGISVAANQLRRRGRK